MNTKFEEIVNQSEIGQKSSKNLNDILNLAKTDALSKAEQDETKVLFLGIDFQNDFMDHGALGVPGAIKDIGRITRFLYDNLHKITKIAVSLDTHKPLQIFHPAWWIDETGKHPEPYTIISASDVDNGKWNPVYQEEKSKEYVQKLEENGKKQLCIWTYHCIEGTFGHSLEGQLANMIYYHSLTRQAEVKTIKKGLFPTTEMYGIFRPELDGTELDNRSLLEEIANYDKILIAGEAKSHCVLESVIQLIDYFNETAKDPTKIYLLEDCMSSITGYEAETDKVYQSLSDKYGIQLVRTDNFAL